MEMLRDVPCPSCSKPLYQTGPVDFAASIFGGADEVPQIVVHKQGDFLRCRHCSMFVQMNRDPSPATGQGLEIHPSRRFLAKIPGEEQ